jgi:hypothetical protein
MKWNGRSGIADNSRVEEWESNEESNRASDRDKVDILYPLSELSQVYANARSWISSFIEDDL